MTKLDDNIGDIFNVGADGPLRDKWGARWLGPSQRSHSISVHHLTYDRKHTTFTNQSNMFRCPSTSPTVFSGSGKLLSILINCMS